MRIGIITQPLHSNYGGILQNYALQTVLKRIGHEVWTVDYRRYNWLDWADRVWRVLAHKMLGHRAKFGQTPTETRRIETPLRRFALKHISLTVPRTRKLERGIVKKYAFDAIVVGSDQVWRPRYNYDVRDCFLRFAEDMPVKRVAYAASFGTDEWEFTNEQTAECAQLAKQFDAISVRENSGVEMSKQYLGVDAVHVLDPTLLLGAADYAVLCKDIPKRKPFVFAYILDESEDKQKLIREFAKGKGLPYFIKGINASISTDDSVERWLSYFRDAAYVITDSFHGTIFSIINNREFYVLGNKERGNSRFESLLEGFGLKDRMIACRVPDSEEKIDWARVNLQRDARAAASEAWLKEALTK